MSNARLNRLKAAIKAIASPLATWFEGRPRRRAALSNAGRSSRMSDEAWTSSMAAAAGRDRSDVPQTSADSSVEHRAHALGGGEQGVAHRPVKRRGPRALGRRHPVQLAVDRADVLGDERRQLHRRTFYKGYSALLAPSASATPETGSGPVSGSELQQRLVRALVHLVPEVERGLPPVLLEPRDPLVAVRAGRRRPRRGGASGTRAPCPRSAPPPRTPTSCGC